MIIDQTFCGLTNNDRFDKECKKIVDKINNPKNYNSNEIITNIRDFFIFVSPSNKPGFKILSTSSRCEGFTLSYGRFYNICDLIEKNKKNNNHADECLQNRFCFDLIYNS